MTDSPGAGPRPLTSAQYGIWAGQQLEPGTPVYNTGEYLEIDGPVDEGALVEAITRTLDEAEGVRVVLGGDATDPVLLPDPHPVRVEVIDLTSEEDPRSAARDLMAEDMRAVIDLTAGPLSRHVLFRVPGEVGTRGTEHSEGTTTILWYHRVHHLALDGYGISLLVRRAAELYTAAVRGLAPRARWFGSPDEVIAADREYLRSDRYEVDRSFWREHLEGRPQPVGLSGRTAALGVRSHRALLPVPEATVLALEELSDRVRSTWADALVGAFAAYLHRLTGAPEVCLAMPVMVRTGTPAVTVPCLTLNAVAVWVDVDPNSTFESLTGAVAELRRITRRHQRYRYEQLRRDLHAVGGARRILGPSVNVMAFDYDLRFGDSEVRAHNVSAGAVDDMALNVYRRARGDGLTLALDANPHLYDHRTVAAHLDRFVEFLDRLVAGPHSPVADLEVTTSAERAAILGPWNDTADHRDPTTVAALWARRVERQPQVPALVGRSDAAGRSGALVSWTAAELDSRVQQLAEAMRECGAGPGAPVLFVLDRTVDAVAATLAAATVGCAHVHADPDHPPARVRMLAEDCSPAVVVTTTAHERSAEGLPVPARLILDGGPGGRVVRTPPPTPVAGAGDPRPEDLLALVYTSGSTGRPKGVAVHHGAMANLCQHHQVHLMEPTERRRGQGPLAVALTASLAFDTSWEGLLWMLCGHTLHLVDERTRREADLMVGYVDEHRIDFLDLTPTYARELLDAGLCGADRHRPAMIALGGEGVDEALWTRLRSIDGVESVNLYGPSECTVDSTWARLSDSALPRIGRPVTNARAYVVDARGRLLPPGCPGDLYIAGTPVSSGYHGRPDLTAERFTEDTFSGVGGRMYRTGDRVAWTVDGDLEYFGREDDQVKIRGVRIETAEIEHRLCEHPAVSAATVLPRPDRRGRLRLVAYVVGTGPDGPGASDSPAADLSTPGPSELVTAELRRHVAETMPYYMVPPTYVVLDRFPLTTNGKLDRSALPDPAEPDTGRRPDRGPERDADPRERELCALIAEVLGVEEPHPAEDLFDLGADSLSIARLTARIRDRWSIPMTILEVFSHPTATDLARIVSGAQVHRSALDGIDLDAECALPTPGHTPSGPRRADGPTRSVLLTGATGYLGAHLLRTLLDLEPVTVTCLVRSPDQDRARDRLSEALDRYGLAPLEPDDRVRAIPGDLSAPGLGIDRDTFARLAEETDLVVHNGARVHHLEPYPRLRRPNVDGTRELLRLALTGPPSRFHYVSTIDTIVSNRDGPSSGGRRVPAGEVVDNGYVASKWVAEGMVLAAADTYGLEVTVSRPARVGPDSRTGIGNPDDAFLSYLRAALRVGALPSSALSGAPVDLVPVDRVARAIIHLALTAPAPGCHQLHCRAPMPMTELLSALRGVGHALEVVDDERWHSALRAGEEAALAEGDPTTSTTLAHLDLVATLPATGGPIRDPGTDELLLGSDAGALETRPAELARAVARLTEVGAP